MKLIFQRSLLFSLCLFFTAFSMAQNKTIKGKVIDEKGEAIVKASVVGKGTTSGTSTNMDGTFTLSVPESVKTLVISAIGFAEQEVPANSTTEIILQSNTTANLDEVVVVGYGSQKKSVVTGAISSVKAKDLENVPNGRIEQALQGRVSGVTILQNSGQPGSTSTIRVRGITTFGGGNNPLWVVDGVVVDAGGIGYLNQSDIESIEVLKDAASAAIYGTRAATGVILVTTKKGKAGKLTVNYNGTYGTSAPARLLDMLNATEYATLMNERAVAGGDPVMFSDVSSLGKGTDWQKAIFNNDARRYSHEISLSGGGDKTTFYLSAGIENQQGIVATDISNYNKKSFRLNSTHKISKIFTFGQTLGYAHQESTGLGNTNSEFGGPLSSAINLDPITPVIITDDAVANAAPYSVNPVVKDAMGRPYGISSIVGQEMTNPLAYIQTRLGGFNWSDDIIGNAYLEAAITNDIKFRSTVGGKLSYWGNEGYTPVFYLNATNQTLNNSYGRGANKGFGWNVENTVTYHKLFGENNVTVLLGQGSYVENISNSSYVTIHNLPITSYKDASFNFDIPTVDREVSASDGTQHKITSLFARVNYSYMEKYLFTGIIRQDGSTRFGPDKKYGYFPSFSLGWNINKEKFWANNNLVSTLKLRGGYGVVGNDNLADFRYISTISGGYNYPVGNTGAVTTGYAQTTLDNPSLHWETTSQMNVGFDARLLNTLNLTVDYYIKKTSGILRPVTIPGYVGVSNQPWANIADMKNNGLEVELGYNKRLGEFNLGINGNVSFLENEVTYVASDADYINGDAAFQSMGTTTRVQVGQPYNVFYGYKTMGIFQNETEINSYNNKDGNPIQPKARPGDFRWQDTNGDGVITEADKTFLGSNIPKYTFGLTVNLSYRNFDFMAFAQGVAGNKIFQGLRRLDISNSNFQTKAMGRWTGEGTSNDFPRLVSNDPNGNFSNMSDFYLEKGDYIRMKLLQVGYTLPRNIFSNAGISRVRLYVTSENLFTITGYDGYDPEVGGGVFGIDKGQYPQARSFIGGIQVQF